MNVCECIRTCESENVLESDLITFFFVFAVDVIDFYPQSKTQMIVLIYRLIFDVCVC